jgi:hypothetical protein
MHAEESDPRWRDRLVPCGVPRTEVLVKTVDDRDREGAAGEVGEVVTRSDCVMGGQCRDFARRLAAHRRSRQL